MLLYLAARRKKASRRALAELLWGTDKTHNVRQEIYRFRKLPGARAWLHDADPLVLTAATDLERFEAAVRGQRFGEALRIWNGPLLDGWQLRSTPAFSEWLEVARRQAEDVLVRALQGRLTELEEQGPSAEALHVAERLLELDPLNEGAHRAVMRLLHQRGDTAAALHAFQVCRRVLRDELGLEPLAATLQLAHDIEQGRAAAPVPAKARRPTMPKRLLRPATLVGREEEWAAMESAWEKGKTIFICGPAGIGKTRLMLDFARSRGSYILTEGRPGDEHVPYSSASRALGRALARFPQLKRGHPHWMRDELARFLPDHFPELNPPPVESTQIQTRLMQALWQLMDRLRRIVAALPADDIQYYDAASGVIGNMLTARFAEQPAPGTAGILVAFRKDEIPAGNLEGIEAVCRAGAAILLELKPLAPAAMRRLVEQLEVPGGRDLPARLYRYAGGNPMFALETLKSLYASEDSGTPGATGFGRPQRAEAVIRDRLGRLPRRAVRLLRAIAVAQPSANPELLGRVLEIEPLDVAEDIGDLELAQFLSGARFVHDLVYETVLAHTPEPILTLLHRRTAEALVERDGDLGQIAHHWLRAGDPERATRCWIQAGRRFREQGLHDGAAAMLRLAIAHAPTSELSHEAKLEAAYVHAEGARYAEARDVVDSLLSEVPNARHEARARNLAALIQARVARRAEGNRE